MGRAGHALVEQARMQRIQLELPGLTFPIQIELLPLLSASHLASKGCITLSKRCRAEVILVLATFLRLLCLVIGQVFIVNELLR